ncbi:abortive infection protein (plasmid) [Leptolyngbya boryana NIES-2135]|jgi:membrane protease YdiL (CAAX protease family)|uniref:Abortive infection protein n=1 Tax=Leptolyngbya boryana NIES-2135 TaxID=1973484 RepID=A0A1Z4JRL4_LEPBY|nr:MULTISPECIES: CPBP family intramembrane glutamic endopeptidase [Leptolyngbya]BAY59369.1 abortive infection protein [Leptolyngbya boryana NIES-2135]MBD2372957.1 CPBP family intramembrane metalloprotease [Leptolyngbya sp. FACHB-238]MBD2397290.1 CPBP family intramembrane metalloprotease [Leptolyngbya sp. FACHB-239]MBD2403905.1 CPBP family intramembrane metalloprotease [Leptolyngbya sp. FACHB-402]ULP33201.1 CPBP family intramembrane metalloprotease [Leptolyngbya boryana IU 594]
MSVLYLSPRIARYPVSARLAIFVITLLGLWLPIALPIYWIWGTNNTISIITVLALYAEFVGLLWIWGRTVHQDTRPLQQHGLLRTRQNWRELLKGIVIGVVSLFCLFLVEGAIGWIEWQPIPQNLLRIILEGLLVAFGVGLAEELLFRGWLVNELRWNYRPQLAIWMSSTAYASFHFIKPWSEILRTLPSFPGLLLLGLTLGWARQFHQGRLGYAIGLHAGLVWGYYIINVGNWVRYLDRVPVWVTGIDRNPLAGGMGLLFLSAIALSLRLKYWT